MKKWEEVAVTGLFPAAIGAMLLVFTVVAVEPIETREFLFSEKHYINEDFLFLFFLGALMLGMGLGCLVWVSAIRKWEEKKE